jgi:YD repeat-containing protein
LTSQTDGNTSVSSYSYDLANRVTDMYHRKSDTTLQAHYQYAYDDAGNVVSRADSNWGWTTAGSLSGARRLSENNIMNREQRTESIVCLLG